MLGEDEQWEPTITGHDQVYNGGDIANWVLQSLVDTSSSGVSVLSLGGKGDAMIMNETGKSFKKGKEMKKDQQKKYCEFEIHEVYSEDVFISSEGKAKDTGQRTTIYKREPSKQYELKMKTSRAFFSEVNRHFDAMPFTLRAFEDEKKARMGAAECAKHELLYSFSALSEKKSEMEVQDAELKALFQSYVSRKAQKKKKKKASKTAENATSEETLEEKEARN
ncbi:Proliferation-associated protein 2G4 [Microtus ochrogaster]|uniref:Proliferation-associated protein 2G4 n=1 Tax=Microtus ochrogaster TaxID=79684 RepID=A0A8J6FXB3_MICOH|nr:Proliferation-associated protein 2G4 [Microtus ochrogaster]